LIRWLAPCEGEIDGDVGRCPHEHGDETAEDLQLQQALFSAEMISRDGKSKVDSLHKKDIIT
jgi:hypothetical protein